MADGLRIYRADGVLLLDATHRCARIKGAVYVTGAPNSTGNQPADLSSGTPFFSFQADRFYYHINQDCPTPIFTVGSTGLSWRYSPSGGTAFTHVISGWCFYGVF